MRPIYEMLRAASGRGRFHMPGHKGRAPFGPVDMYVLDTTELPVTDDLYAPENGIRRAEVLYAGVAGAAETLFLHNGSSSGIHVMLQLWATEGDTVLLPRNAHMSAVNGCIMGGMKVRWIPVAMGEDGYACIREDDVLRALDENPGIKALLLTRPDVYGGCLPLENIIRKAHAMGVKVAVDEAHGAHLPWMQGVPSAGALGADAWVQSVHKTLPGLTGSAVLHLKNSADRARAIRLLRREQTSSPSFVLLMSIDDARAWMDDHGEENLRRVIARAEEIRSLLPKWGYSDAHEVWRKKELAFDPTRLVIDAPQGGEALAQALQEKGIDTEMHDYRRVVLILAAQDSDDDFARLAQAMASIRPHQASLRQPSVQDKLPERVMEVRSAVMAPCEEVSVLQAAGRIAAAPAGLYPPGIPLVCPGEVIDEDVIKLLDRAGPQQRFGLEGDCLLCVSRNV